MMSGGRARKPLSRTRSSSPAQKTVPLWRSCAASECSCQRRPPIGWPLCVRPSNLPTSPWRRRPPQRHGSTGSNRSKDGLPAAPATVVCPGARTDTTTSDGTYEEHVTTATDLRRSCPAGEIEAPSTRKSGGHGPFRLRPRHRHPVRNHTRRRPRGGMARHLPDVPRQPAADLRKRCAHHDVAPQRPDPVREQPPQQPRLPRRCRLGHSPLDEISQ